MRIGRRNPDPVHAVIVIITLLSAAALTVLGVVALASPGSVLPAGTVINVGVTYYARHLASRNFALAVFMVVALILKDNRMLRYLLLLNAIVQALDAIFAMPEGNAARVVAPLVVCVLDLGAVGLLIRTS
jgi:hypothetical protein